MIEACVRQWPGGWGWWCALLLHWGRAAASLCVCVHFVRHAVCAGMMHTQARCTHSVCVRMCSCQLCWRRHTWQARMRIYTLCVRGRVGVCHSVRMHIALSSWCTHRRNSHPHISPRHKGARSGAARHRDQQRGGRVREAYPWQPRLHFPNSVPALVVPLPCCPTASPSKQGSSPQGCSAMLPLPTTRQCTAEAAQPALLWVQALWLLHF